MNSNRDGYAPNGLTIGREPHWAVKIVFIFALGFVLLVWVMERNGPQTKSAVEAVRLQKWGDLSGGERGDFIVMTDGKLIGMMANKPNLALELVYFVEMGDMGHVTLEPNQCPRGVWQILKPDQMFTLPDGSVKSYNEYAGEWARRSSTNFKEYRTYEIK